MSKLKNIIKQLSDNDYQTIFGNLMDNSAEKSAMLLKYLKEKLLNDAKIMSELDVNPNAYYTLRSRLNEKIEEYLVTQMESPKTDILKKVASINEMMFTKKRTIVLATLKKLEKELIDFDLSSELIIVYKSLKKLNVNTPDQYVYSQLYNKHVAYTLALDKTEDILAEYFKKYGTYFLTAEDVVKEELTLLLNEINNMARLYQSHRLFVYNCCASIFHKMYVDANVRIIDVDQEEISIEDAFEKIDLIMETYATDPNYHHLRLVFDFLKMLYFGIKKIVRKSDKHFNDVNEYAAIFLSNYSLYTFSPMFLLAKIERNMRDEQPNDVLENYKILFSEFESDPKDLASYMVLTFYKIFCYFNAEKFDLCAKSIHTILNEVSLKRYQDIQLEIKTFLSLQYCLLDDFDLFNQLMNSIQRQVRMMGKKRLEHIVLICKIMKVSLSAGANRQKAAKIKMLSSRLNMEKVPYFSPFKHINFKDELLNKLSL
ncbi:MAG: hypothetical protein ACKVOU_13860 [Cytophagales bacterium]